MAANSVFIGSQSSSNNSSATNFFSSVAAATTTLTGNQTAVDVTGKNRLLCNNATLLTIQGLLGGIEGQELTIVSIGAGQVNLAHQNGGASAGNKLTNYATSAPTPLAAGFGKAKYVYTSSNWVLESHEQGDWINQPFNAGDFTGSGTLVWTVDSGDDVTFRYWLRGRDLDIDLDLRITSISGTGTDLQITPPGGFTLLNLLQRQVMTATDNNLTTSVAARIQQVSGKIVIQQPVTIASNWTASTNQTSIFAEFRATVT